MARTYSNMLDLGTTAPGFHLPAANPLVDRAGGSARTLHDYDSFPVLIVVFTCNHCPYAQHVEPVLIDVFREYHPKGVAMVAVSSNDPEAYPEDSFVEMARRALEKEYPFPYLFDESQDVAAAYRAACTPDVYVFDRERKLVYRGRVDESRPGQGTSTGADLRTALDQLLETGQVTMEQLPSMGCNIKWKSDRLKNQSM